MSFLILTVAALIASSMTAASAFNYATLSRNVGTTVVTDDGSAYIYLQSVDSTYACLLNWNNGKLDVTFDNGPSCSSPAIGTGVNPDSVFYFSDVMKVTNKGRKDLTGLWLNFTDDVIQTKSATSAGTNMATTAGWEREHAVGALTSGSSIYVSFKIDTDTTNLDTTAGTLTKSMTIQARASN